MLVATIRHLLACALAAALLAAPAAAASDPQNCGTVIVPPGIGAGDGDDITSFNPMLVASLYDAEAADLMFMQLIWIDPQHHIDYSRSLASAVATPDNGTTFNVALRPWHWSDGVPVTAQDVLYTFNLAKSLGDTWTANGSGGMPDIIKSFTITDPTHFTIVLKRQVNPDWFILDGLTTLEPVPAHIWRHYTGDQIWQNQSSPAFFKVVDGPLIVTQLAIGLDAVFVPNPNYEGPKLHLTRFIMKFINGEGTELQQAQSGDIDMANLPFDLFDLGSHIPGLHLVTLPPGYGYNEFIPNIANTEIPYFADVRIRQAIAAAIDQNQIIGLAMHGQGLPVYTAVPPVPDTFLSPAARAGAEPDGYNPARAIALLEQAGFTPGPGGIRQNHGTKLSFTAVLAAGRPEAIEIAEAVQQNLRAVGIDLKVHQIEFNQLLALLAGPPNGWQAMFIGNTINAYPSGENGFLTGSFYDQNGYGNAQMDKYINQSTYQPGLDGLFAFEDFSAVQQPVIFLPVEKYTVIVRDGLHGVDNFISPLGYWAPDALYCTDRQATS
jgi:peptide/nickel transport system substrate-binding protein